MVKHYSNFNIQKIHKGVVEGKGNNMPDATFKDFKSLRKLILKLA